MDVLAELESMANNISLASECIVSDADIARWQRLFNFTKSEAVRRIEDYRNDYTKTRTSEELWTTIRPTKEGGRLRPRKPKKAQHQQDTSGTYLLRLEGPLDTAQKVKTAAGLADVPATTAGVGGSGACTTFCELDGRAKAKILACAWERPFSSVLASRKMHCDFTKQTSTRSSGVAMPLLGVYSRV
ncbi:hypothetical protein A1O7_04444 [Cladophialophora yegresii CBS 114405]|uniref:Uncharacterized protein n=1 Tax=Cladophialophora yegresii CBS 114405 TaxID=1182544 RepID=W9VWT1_9EURO|nr:uncharacterized protein A1O7_04444 [Cladophialophora yegresii CBS 114405]EXJ60292.1 hypothetical protein A1O7_04444 [Cladophialophora yegresii CBS 114405]